MIQLDLSDYRSNFLTLKMSARSANVTDVIIDLTINIAQIFTELYQAYGLLEPPPVNVFENSIYIDPTVPQPRPILAHMDCGLRRFHEIEGTLELYLDPNHSILNTDVLLLPGNGSTQIYKGIVYALAMGRPNDRFLIVEKIPYFAGHASAVQKTFPYPNARFQGYRNPSEIVKLPGEILVEFVTSPNNPDGEFRRPETNPDVIIADFVFTSTAFGDDGTGYIQRNIEWIHEARAAGKTVFSYNSSAKQFGKTGDRLGYIWWPLYDPLANGILAQFLTFLSITVGGPILGSSDLLNLLRLLEEPQYGPPLRQNAHASLVKRHTLMASKLVQRYPGSTIVSIPGSPTMFAKIVDPRISLPTVTAADVIFADTQTRVTNGAPFGEDNTFVRINLMSFSPDLVVFLNRLVEQPGKVTRRDVLVVSPEASCQRTKTTRKRICSAGGSRTLYVVNPNDRCIQVDASTGPIEIQFPPFESYERSQIITVKRVDTTVKNKVIVRSSTFAIILRHQGDRIAAQWHQPFYQDGHWTISQIHNKGTKGNNSNNGNNSNKIPARSSVHPHVLPPMCPPTPTAPVLTANTIEVLNTAFLV
jgi:hypothetical protein